jgi:hypothetical protein
MPSGSSTLWMRGWMPGEQVRDAVHLRRHSHLCYRLELCPVVFSSLQLHATTVAHGTAMVCIQTHILSMLHLAVLVVDCLDLNVERPFCSGSCTWACAMMQAGPRRTMC